MRGDHRPADIGDAPEPRPAAELHSALRQEPEALVYERPFDNDMAPLPAERDVQRQAVKAALSGPNPEAQQPTVTIEAGQVHLA